MMQTSNTKKQLLLSGSLICLSLLLLFFSASCWGILFTGLKLLAIAFVMWICWLIHLIWMLFKRPIGLKRRSILLFFICSILASGFVIHSGKWLRDKKVHKAINNGLYQDCMQLLDHWPSQKSTLWHGTPEYAKLSKNIQRLAPIYVTNDKIECANIVPNIGICNDGFGGFHGIRVFRNDQDAEIFGKEGSRSIAPCMYYYY